MYNLVNSFYQNDNSLEELKSNYDTKIQSKFESILLYIYPVYWLTSSIFIFYMMHNYLIFKLLIGSALVIYTYLQLIGKGIDDLIMNVQNKQENGELLENNKKIE